ncbi:MAG TPA: DUF4142 domain-containing protein [Thermoanaerobaculia bacterium]|nr:DUF4142 domain-containing protein [Thermoanaerobaculia bacterium]
MKIRRIPLAAAVMAAAVACHTETVHETPTETVVTDTRPLDPVSGRGGVLTLEEFVSRAGADGLTEIHLAEIARARARDEKVRELAQTVLIDHTRISERLASIAASKNLAVPNALPPDGKEIVARLTAVGEGEVDREYLRTLIDEHRKAIELYGLATTSSLDPAFAGFAAETLPILQRHHEEAERLAGAGGPD